jgi:hypothetical protein
MLLISIKSEPNAIKWTLNQPPPKHIAHFAVSVTATGKELSYIRNRFTNLPNVDRNLPHDRVTWFDSDAKFIVANLK